MEFLVCTCDREPAYIHQTLATLLLQVPDTQKVYLVMDSEVDYLPQYTSPRIAKFGRPDSFVQGYTRRLRAASNYERCLIVAQLFEDVVICEDDVIFNSSALSNLQYCISEIEDLIGKDAPYVLALGDQTIHPQEAVEYIKDKPFVRIHQAIHGPTLELSVPLAGIYYPKTFNMRDFCQHMKVFGVEVPPKGGGHDIAASWYWTLHNIPVYNASPPIVTLIGKKTSIDNHLE